MKWFERVMLVIVVLVRIKDMKNDITNLCVLKCVWLCSWLQRSADNFLLLSVAKSGRVPIMFHHSWEGALFCLLLFVVSLFAFSFFLWLSWCFERTEYPIQSMQAELWLSWCFERTEYPIQSMQAELSLTPLQHMSVIENPTCKVLFDIKWSHWLKLLYMTCGGVFLLSVVVFFPRTDLQQISCGEVTMQMVVWFCKLCKVLVMKIWTPFIRECPVWTVNKSG